MAPALLLVAVLSAEGADAALPLRIEPVRTVIATTAEIGKRGAGWTCFPAGAIRWRDLSFDANAAAAAVTRSLVAHGVEASTDTRGEGDKRGVVAATIRSATVKACSPQHGIGKLLGHAPRLKGRIALTIGWAVRRGEISSAFETRSDVEVSMSSDDLGAMLEAGLERAGNDVARQLKALSSG